MFDGLIKELKKLEHTSYSMKILADEDGYVDKECPDSKCLKKFKVYSEDWNALAEDAIIHCPFCGFESTINNWFTTEQVNQAREQAIQKIHYDINNALKKGAKEANNKLNRSFNRKSFIKMSISYKGNNTYFVDMPAQALDEIVLCKDETIKKLKESNIECVAMSMHYGIQEDISVIPQKLVEDNIKMLKENNIGSKIFVTITKKNYKLVPEICEYVASLGVHGVWFTNYIKQGQAINLEDNGLNEEEKKEFFKLLNEARSKYNKEELNIERCGSFGKDTYKNNNNFRCTAIHDFVVLTPYYNVYPCFFLAKEGNEIGKYDNGKIMLYDEYKEEWEGCLTTRICNNEDYRIENHKLIRIKKQ